MGAGIKIGMEEEMSRTDILRLLTLLFVVLALGGALAHLYVVTQ